MKRPVTLVLIADDEAARFIVTQKPQGRGRPLAEIASLSISQFPADDLDYADRRGRSAYGEGNTAMQGFDPHTALSEQKRNKFASHILQALAGQWESTRPDKLVLVAPPKMLGVLRARLPAALKAALVADLAKEHINTPIDDLPDLLAGLIPL